MKVLLAPDSFKGTLRADEVCEICAQAFLEVCPDCSIQKLPVADGGEGLCAAIQAAVGGETVTAETTGVFGEKMYCTYLRLADGTAVIEMAACAGLPLAQAQGRMNPEQASTEGVGALLRHAAENGAKRVLLGLGGSATTDCGMGMASVLGYRFSDEKGCDLYPVGANMARVSRIIAPSKPYPLPVTAACDVDNPLYGEQGAAMVFAPQKGADTAMVRRLNAGLMHMAERIRQDINIAIADIPGAGAAGGLGAGVLAFLGGGLKSGIDLVLDAAGFDRKAAECDIVLTGEGMLDSQSLRGKVVAGVAQRAKKAGTTVIALCGCMQGDTQKLEQSDINRIYACGKPGRSLEELQKVCRQELYETARIAALEFTYYSYST